MRFFLHQTDDIHKFHLSMPPTTEPLGSGSQKYHFVKMNQKSEEKTDVLFIGRIERHNPECTKTNDSNNNKDARTLNRLP